MPGLYFIAEMKICLKDLPPQKLDKKKRWNRHFLNDTKSFLLSSTLKKEAALLCNSRRITEKGMIHASFLV
jgi:hypothetical protein